MAKKKNFDIKLTDSTIIRIAEREYKGKTYVDIRKMYLSDEEYKFTPKGIMIPTEKFNEVQLALGKIKRK